MKKILIIGIVATILVANFTSCKKGDHDPILSLKTRKARLVRKWIIASFEQVYISTSINPYTLLNTGSKMVISFNGSIETTTLTNTVSGVSTSSSTVNEYAEEIEFIKDGTFKHTRIDNLGTRILGGNWMFLGKNKEAKIKNKEAIFLNYSTTTYIDVSGVTTTSTETGFQGNSITYLIDELKSKELTLMNEITNSQSSNSNTSSGKTTITLKAK